MRQGDEASMAAQIRLERLHISLGGLGHNKAQSHPFPGGVGEAVRQAAECRNAGKASQSAADIFAAIHAEIVGDILRNINVIPDFDAPAPAGVRVGVVS